MKKGKELKLDLFENYNIVSGSVDNKHSKAIYVNLSAWAQPELDHDDIDYNRVIRDLNKELKRSIYQYLIKNDKDCTFVKSRSIVDLDIRKSGIRFNKRSFSNAEITLFLTNEIPVNSDRIRPIINDIVNTVIMNVFEDNKYFKFYRRKI